MYLGFQIGYNTPPKTIIAPVIHSIQQKLIHWSLKKLTSGTHHSGESGITCNNVVQVQPIILDYLQRKYTSNLEFRTQLHLVI